MKLTYNNCETNVTVEGTQEEVFAWYKTFVHSQQDWEDVSNTAFVELINRKTSDKEANKVKNIVNDPRAGEPDEDGWMTWAATDSEDIPNGLSKKYRVDFEAKHNSWTDYVGSLYWAKCTNEITKFRVSK